MQPLTDIRPLQRRTLLAHRILLVVLLAVLCLGNAALGWLMDRIGFPTALRLIAVGMGYGMIFAQFGLHAIWTVFSRVTPAYRALASINAVLLLFMSFWAPVVLSNIEYSLLWLETCTALLCLPLLLLAVQVPLWCLKAFAGWRILGPHDGEDPQSLNTTGRLSILSLLLATAAVAIALGCARMAAWLVEANVAEMSVALFVTAGIEAAVSLVTTVPILFATLRSRRWLVVLPVLVILYASVVLSVESMIASVQGRSVRVDMQYFFGAATIAFVVILTTPLLVARRLGYRLVVYRGST